MQPHSSPDRPCMPGMDASNLRREIQSYAESHPQDTGLRDAVRHYGTEWPYLTPMAAYATLEPDTRERLLEWIATMLAPAAYVYRPNSYSIKHDAEHAIASYITNDQFNGAMLVSGYAPTPDTRASINWRFRMKSTVPPSQRPPAGQRGFAGLRVSPETFGAILRQHRQAKELGLRQFAKIIGISSSYLSNIEHGKFPPPAEDKVVAMAKELGVHPDVLLADAGRVASDVLETVRQQPVEMAKLVRAAGRLGADRVDWVAEQLEEQVHGQ